jgi:adenylate kinase
VRLVFLGPPGAGKGTQASRIASAFGVPAISTGDIFRANVKEGTPLGQEAKRYMDAGEYVPDSVTNAMVRDRLAQPDAAAGFLLDGYPRTVDQVHELDGMLEAAATSLDKVVELTADRDEVVRRLLHRAEIEGRADDTAEVITHRLEVYAEETAQLANLYAERGLLVQVDGMGEVDDVTARLLDAIGDHDDVAVG